MQLSAKQRWVILFTAILAAILIPFFLFGAQIETWTRLFLEAATHRSGWVAVILGLLLAADILLPVPSSLVSTAAGMVLGFTVGTATSLIGMTISCAVGFWLGLRFGRPLATRMVGDRELERLERIGGGRGDWIVAVMRPVPVLAEASVFFAGMSRMPAPRFFILSTLANLGISSVYAAVGALSATVHSFLLALAGAILIPLIAMGVFKKA